jgi:hypothetical protein
MPARTQEKSARVVRFLLSLRHVDVRSAMKACNMTDADAEEGWSLLRALGAGRFERTPMPPPPDTVLLDLCAWQTLWLPVAEATLGRCFPAVKERVFLNLSRTPDRGASVAVRVLVDRLGELRDPRGRSGLDGPRALGALAARGLDQAVIDRGRALLEALRHTCPSLEPEPREAIERDQDALWRWYLEWATIARGRIKERALLRRMGLRRAGGTEDDAEKAEARGLG